MVNEENEKTIIRTSRLIDKANNKLFEQVLGGVYVTYDNTNNIVKKVSQVETSKFVFIPIDNKTTKAKAIKLPLTVKEYGRTSNLLKEIENHIYKYLDVSNQFRKLSSWFILMSWIPDNLNTVNYLRALGDWGSGKSRFFNIVGGLCYKPIPMAGAINPAPLYRLMDMWKGTMLLDECVLNKSDESSYIVQILNAGIERGKYVWRCDTEDVKDVEPFDPFGPKVIAARVPFKDNALESRCITEKLKPTKRKDIPVDLPPECFVEQEELRNKLLMFRLRNWNRIDGNNINKIKLPECSNRLQQMMIPFAVTFYKFPDIIKNLNSFIIEYYTQQVENNSQTLQGGIVNALFELRIRGVQQITSKDIRNKMGDLGYETDRISEVKIGKERSGLGITAKQMTIDGSSKMSVVWNNDIMDSLMKRYVTKERQQYFKENMTRKKIKPVRDDDWEVDI